MLLEQTQSLSQKLALTQSMRQSLECLQLSAPELSEYVQNAALSNPLLDVQAPTYYETELPRTAVSAPEAPELRETDSWQGVRTGTADTPDLSAFLTREETFRDYLNEQIGQTKLVDGELLRLCRFLIDCLDERGYLDCPLEELAAEFQLPLFSLKQALYAIQMLDPPGVGARNLSECLTLQLVQKRKLDPLALAIARIGLEPLSRRDYTALSSLLGCSTAEARRAAEAILALNPIPARGFAGSGSVDYIVPDAVFRVEQGRLVIELNEKILPRLSVNAEYAALLDGSDEPETQRYVKEKLNEAHSLIKGVRTRCDTLLRLITLLAEVQQDYFLHGGELAPVTMQQLAERMGLSVSTVSRASQNKYIQFQGKVLPIRSLFAAAIPSDGAVSAEGVKQRMRILLKNESHDAPLSDEELRLALGAQGIEVSRRVIAKYRTAMGIPSSSQRRGRTADRF